MNSRLQLRESSLKRSNVYTNQLGRSFISTHLAQDSLINGNDLRKSRIQNLPSYKKTNLGDNPQFVIVFQTIQIQRLSNQIQVLRVKLKQSERLLFNAQNNEVQIRQLTQKCFNYERELSQYRDQIENLNRICENLYHQNESLKSKLNEIDITIKQKYEMQKTKNLQLQQDIQKWKNRYQASEKSKARELQDLRNLMDSQRKSMIDREIRQITIRFHNQRSGLQNEIRKCRELLQLKNIDCQELKKKSAQQEISITEMQTTLYKIEQLQTKISLLSQQLVRLNEVLRNRQDSIQNYKKLQYELSLKLKQKNQQENQYTQIQNLLQIKLKEINDWKSRCARFQQELNKNKDLQLYNHQLEQKLQLSSKQAQRFNIMVKQKLQEIEKWKQKLQQKQRENTKLRNIETQIPQYQAKLNMLKAQNQRINSILKSRLTEIQTLKKKSGELESMMTKMTLIQKDKLSLQERFNQQIKNHQELKFKYSKIESDLNMYKKYEAKCRQLQNSNQGLIRQSDRLNHNIKSQAEQLKDYKQKISQLEHKLSDYKMTEDLIHDYEGKTVLLTQEIERLNGLIKTKNKDIDTLEEEKLELYTKVNGYKNYEHKLSEKEQTVANLQNNIKSLKKDMQEWQIKYRNADSKIRQLENNLFTSNNEKDKLSMTLRSKQGESEQYKTKYRSLELEMRQFSEMKMMCQQQHNQLILFSNDIESYKRKVKQLEQQLTKQKNKSNEAIRKLSTSNSELEKINRELQRVNNQVNTSEIKMKAERYDQLFEQFSKLTVKSKSTQTQLTQIIAKSEHLQLQIQKITQHFNRLLQQAYKSEQETQNLIQPINQYQDYANKISILDAELNRLQIQNKKLEQDNKQMRLKYSEQINLQKQTLQNNLVKVLMAIEIQSLRKRLDQRELSMQEMKKSILEPVRKV